MYAVLQQRARVGAALEWRPEWPFAVVVVVAWVVLLAGSAWPETRAPDPGAPVTQVSTRDALGHHGHPTPGAAAMPRAHGASGGMLQALTGWGLMSVAMMLPVTLPAVGHVGVNSLRRRRQRAMAIYVAVYVGIWLCFGVMVLAGERWLRDAAGVDGRVLLASALAVAAAWQVTRCKRRALFQCRRTVPLPPVGLRADAGCAHFAVRQGWRCVRSCWALMAVMAVVGHSGIVLMVAITTLIVMEELTRDGQRLLRPSAGVLAVASGLVALGV